MCYGRSIRSSSFIIELVDVYKMVINDQEDGNK